MNLMTSDLTIWKKTTSDFTCTLTRLVLLKMIQYAACEKSLIVLSQALQTEFSSRLTSSGTDRWEKALTSTHSSASV